MTPEAAVAAVRAKGHIVIVHKGQVFFNTTDYQEALGWEQKGAIIVPHYSLDEIEHRRKKGRRTVPGWEVHISGACTRVEVEDVDGDLVDVTKDMLLAAAREKIVA